MSVRWDGRHWATESTSPADRQFCHVCALRACNDATRTTLRRRPTNGVSDGSFIGVSDPGTHPANSPGGGAYEAAAATLA